MADLAVNSTLWVCVCNNLFPTRDRASSALSRVQDYLRVPALTRRTERRQARGTISPSLVWSARLHSLLTHPTAYTIFTCPGSTNLFKSRQIAADSTPLGLAWKQ